MRSYQTEDISFENSVWFSILLFRYLFFVCLYLTKLNDDKTKAECQICSWSTTVAILAWMEIQSVIEEQDKSPLWPTFVVEAKPATTAALCTMLNKMRSSRLPENVDTHVLCLYIPVCVWDGFCVYISFIHLVERLRSLEIRFTYLLGTMNVCTKSDVKSSKSSWDSFLALLLMWLNIHNNTQLQRVLMIKANHTVALQNLTFLTLHVVICSFHFK